MIKVDVRNLSSPIPVLWTQKAMEEDAKETIEVLLNDTVNRYNIVILAQNNHYRVSEETDGEETRLILTPGE